MKHFRMCEGEPRKLVFPWVNFNAAYIVRTATINYTCLNILFEICFEMMILQSVNRYSYCVVTAQI